eukprot:jgi/Bigna1/71701/fgenesh1_pg.16_\
MADGGPRDGHDDDYEDHDEDFENLASGETGTLLGFAEPLNGGGGPPLISRFFPSKVGGKPAWLNLRNIPEAPKCLNCKEVLSFLLQVYAPRTQGSNKDDAFHRTIFVFTCKKASCLRTGKSIRVFRSQLGRNNEYYSSEPPVELIDGDENDGFEVETDSLNPVEGVYHLNVLMLLLLWYAPTSYANITVHLCHVCGVLSSQSSSLKKKSKGLLALKKAVFPEYELVIEPEMQEYYGNNSPKMEWYSETLMIRFLISKSHIALICVCKDVDNTAAAEEAKKEKKSSPKNDKKKEDASDHFVKEKELLRKYDEEMKKLSIKERENEDKAFREDAGLIRAFSGADAAQVRLEARQLAMEAKKKGDKQKINDNDDDEDEDTKNDNSGAGGPDLVFDRFQAFMRANPEQVIRYNRLAENVPKCKYCGGQREFEFQIMPQLLNYLNIDHFEKDSLDWGIIACYTCSGSCGDGSKAYFEEFAHCQNIIDPEKIQST